MFEFIANLAGIAASLAGITASIVAIWVAVKPSRSKRKDDDDVI